MPVERTGVVHPELRPRATGGVVKLGDQVAARTTSDRVETGGRRVPEAETLVVLGRGDDVLGPSTDQLAHEGIRVERRGVPPIGQVLVRGAGAEQLLVALPGGAARDPHRVAVPLGVLMPGVRILGRDVHAVAVLHRPRRHRVQPPVDEEPELRVPIPVGHPLSRVHRGVNAEVGACPLLEVHHASCSSAVPRRTTVAVRSGSPSASNG